MTLHNHRSSPGRGSFLSRRIKAGGLVMISTRLPPADAKAFADRAEARGVPMARVIREALRDYLDRDDLDRAPP